MIILYALAALLGGAVVYQAVGSYIDARRFPPLGRLLNTGSCRLHLRQGGTGGPVVVLESGVAASSISWALVQPQVAEFTRVASYDRAGLGWSGKSTAPRTVEQMVSELAALLAEAQRPPPYVLVGHSFGGLLIRAYAHLRPAEVAGLVFLDPVSLRFWSGCAPDDLERLRTGARLARRGALLAQVGVVRAALAILASGGRRLPAWIARASARRATGLVSNIVGQMQKLPPIYMPMIRSHWSSPKSFRALAAYLECLPASARAALEMPIPPAIPFIVLSASSATPDELRERDEWVQQNAHARHTIVENSGHWLQLERPDVVIEAIQELVNDVHSQPGT
ncbi:MAG TPA: alpha/beta hydrolase [Bryobacteraceae bacterium]|nr:alpha/beta hydrolase [Bryobacteraceae bacterium]